MVNEWTVKEHLLYEIADPSRYLMPDGVADFTALRVDDEGESDDREADLERDTYDAAANAFGLAEAQLERQAVGRIAEEQ